MLSVTVIPVRQRELKQFDQACLSIAIDSRDTKQITDALVPCGGLFDRFSSDAQRSSGSLV